MTAVLPQDQLQRIARMFEKHLGRELTAEERKYLGLSASVEPIGYRELQGERRRNEAKEKTGQNKAKGPGFESLGQPKINL